MESKKVLFISQEITPYLSESKISRIGRYLPQGIQERGKEIRTFMPRYGCINERRNQLHEVIRLSGMNLIIDDTDHPLIIKVASIQSARMQVYFIDNDDYFQRKHVVADSNGKEFEDNDERALFFARGVIETVKKLRWAPDIVHCHGWMSALVPVYLRDIYHDDPLFSDFKIVYSVYNNEFKSPFRSTFADKLRYDGIDGENLKLVKKPDYLNISKLAIRNSDGIIIGSEKINPELMKYIESTGKPVLGYQDEEIYIDAYNDFYDTLLSQKIQKPKH
ncbi:MAG TPA: glycogen/starch synthase [Bacteroidales bacterium]|nr:glycogen/starch synthase [Bacteroidales bacterium]HRR92740.1 glycogen/starch synthase [Bacteroidales bacterium]HRT88693.1 glycogen/starch synthase [Bacteroidales bacterium]